MGSSLFQRNDLVNFSEKPVSTRSLQNKRGAGNLIAILTGIIVAKNSK